MNKLSLILDAGKHAVYLDRFITTGYDSKMHVKSIGVYWKFKNVLKSVNDSINTITGGVNIDPITFREGYWSFNMITDTDRNFDSNGRRSKFIATVPVTSKQSLNSSVTFYNNIRSEVSALNGDHNMFEFDVNTDIGNKVGLTIMFEVYVE